LLNWISLNLPILICLIVGMGLLVVEMCIPGFGLPGTAGVVLLIAALYMVWNAAGPLAALGVFLMILAAAGIAMSVIMRSARHGRLSRSPFVLRDESTTATEPSGGPDLSVVKVGRAGRTLTPLRPAGMADVEGERLNVVSEGEFIPKDSPVIIERVEGSRIVVKMDTAAM
jgi:membrane-bound ClpP family serine protease